MSTTETTPDVNRRPAGIRSLIVISLLLHIPLFIYPVLRLCGWLDLNWLVTLVILVPIVLSQAISRVLLRNVRRPLTRSLRHVADFILGMSPLVVLVLVCFELPVALGLVSPTVAALLTLAISAVLSLTGLLMALLPMVRPVRFSAPALKTPVRFVQITDVHMGSRNRQFLERIVNRIIDLEPDFLCITGDFIDATGVTLEDIGALRKLACPIYFSIGNHERYEDLEDILDRLESLAVVVLRSQAVHFRPDLQVIGIDDRDDALQVKRELGRLKVDERAFNLLMYHRPRGLEAAAEAGIDLMISGHTHNGQIFPFNLIVNRVFDRVVGMYHIGHSRLYVSQGTGTWGPVMRVGTRSEITLFELTP